LEVRSTSSADFFPDDPILRGLFGFSTDVGVFFFVIVVECEAVMEAERHCVLCFVVPLFIVFTRQAGRQGG